MPVFVLTEEDFRSRCFCLCGDGEFRGRWDVHHFGGTRLLEVFNGSVESTLAATPVVPKPLTEPNNEVQLEGDEENYWVARFDKMEATHEMSWSSSRETWGYHGDTSNNTESLLVYKNYVRVGSLNMNLTVTYLDTNKLNAEDTIMEDEDYVINDYTGSTFEEKDLETFSSHYVVNGEVKSYVRNVTETIVTWEVLADKSLIQKYYKKQTIRDLVTDPSTSPPTYSFNTRVVEETQPDEVINFRPTVHRTISQHSRIAQFLNLTALGVGTTTTYEETGAVTLNATVGSRSYSLIQDSQRVENRNASGINGNIPFQLSSLSQSENEWDSTISRLVPNLFQIKSRVENQNTLKYFPHGEDLTIFDASGFTPIGQLAPDFTNTGIPLTFDYGHSIFTLGTNVYLKVSGWVFDEDTYSREVLPKATQYGERDYYSPIINPALPPAQERNYTYLNSYNFEDNYQTSFGAVNYYFPGSVIHPRDIE